MGRDKALLPFRGRPLISTVAEAVERAAGSATLVGNSVLGEATGFPAIPDLYPGEGPLGGILTALRHTAAEWNLIVACDMPGLDAAFLSGLLAAAGSGAVAAVVPYGPSGHPEPLCAVYRRDALAALERAFAAGIRKVTAAFEGLEIHRYPVTEVTPLQNVNTPEDWSVYAAE
jgi:molybdopterin-guanine dinucleotide biosynthesis protein A